MWTPTLIQKPQNLNKEMWWYLCLMSHNVGLQLRYVIEINFALLGKSQRLTWHLKYNVEFSYEAEEIISGLLHCWHSPSALKRSNLIRSITKQTFWMMRNSYRHLELHIWGFHRSRHFYTARVVYSLHSFNFIPHNTTNAPLHFPSLLRAVKWLDVYQITFFVKNPCRILFILRGLFVGRQRKSIDLAL